MMRTPPKSTRTDTLFPYTTHFRSFRLRRAGGGWRVAIVDEAERMNRNAENALLKILEEPPANTLIILVSNALNAMLPTARSRCRRLVLKPLDDSIVHDRSEERRVGKECVSPCRSRGSPVL